MGLAAGAFDQRVTLQVATVTRDALQEDIKTWAKHAEVWARVEPLRSKEWFAAGQMHVGADYRVTIRWRSDLVSTMRVVWRGQPLEIVGIPIDVNGRRENLELMCSSGVRDGQ